MKVKDERGRRGEIKQVLCSEDTVLMAKSGDIQRIVGEVVGSVIERV